MNKLIYPDWNNNILNVSAALAKYIGVDSKDYTRQPDIESKLKKGYKNVVFLILDGFGVNVLKKHCTKEDILQRGFVKKLTSTFPSTTTNATTSLMTLSYPGEHNWLGWSLYFEKERRCVDIFLNKDSETKESVENFSTINTLPFTAYYNRERKSDIDVYSVFPSYVKNGVSSNNYPFSSNAEMFDYLKEVINLEGKKFVYCYCGYPDYIMHDYGVSSTQAKESVRELNNGVQRLIKESTDTLIIVTADHGHIDVKGWCELFNDKDILPLLNHSASLDARAVSFSVKKGNEKAFEKAFNKNYGQHFTLFPSSKLIEEGVFGPRVNDFTLSFLGDYVAIGGQSSHTMLIYEDSHRFSGHHTALTEEEMLIPLIMIDSNT